MSYKTYTTKQEVTAVDIHTMAEMTKDDYENYLKNGLFFVDHHDVLRSEPAGYPLAVTKEQAEILLAHLIDLVRKVGE